MSFSFGTPSSAPATGLSTGFSFGANKPATPGFGLGATTQASTGLFGSTPATSAPAFGSTTPAFGAASTTGFGAAAAPAFGAGTTPAFGATGTSAFGATTTPAFGATSAPAFGTTTAPALGTATTATGLSFGTSTTSTAPATGLSFGGLTSTSTANSGLGGFGFGTATTAQNTGFGLFGATSTAATTSNLFGAKLGTTTAAGSQLSTTATPSLGLGGVACASSIGAGNTTASDGKSEPPKQNKLPNEILTSVDSFKEFVKKQKSLSSEVMRVSNKPLHKVCMEAESTLRAASALLSSVGGCRASSRRLRSSVASALHHADLAHTPGFQLEGPAPPDYVKELMSELEQQLITFRRQMDVANKQMQSSPKLLTEQELTLGIRRMHESLVALAGRLQAVHTQVESQKEQYLNLRKYVLKDPTDVFENPSKNTSLDQILREAEGTRKKVKSSHNISDLNLGSAVLSDPRVALGNIQQLAGPTPFSYFGNALSPFPNTDNSGSSWQPQTNVNTSFNASAFGSTSLDSSAFNLQKPPGKRGKQ